jgi:hypothetical protein
MHTVHTAQPIASHVTAVFDGGMLDFGLPYGATLEDLAARLDRRLPHLRGKAITVNVKFAAETRQ